MKTFYILEFTDKRNGCFGKHFYSLKKAQICLERVAPFYPGRTIEIRKINDKENTLIEAWQYNNGLVRIA